MASILLKWQWHPVLACCSRERSTSRVCRLWVYSTHKMYNIKPLFWALWHGKVSALVPQVLATQACGIKLAFSMCLLQWLHCTDEAHIGRNRAHCLQHETWWMAKNVAELLTTSCPARRCSHIRAPCWTLSLRSSCSAQLSRFVITLPRDEQTPLWRKFAHLWACIIAALALEKKPL